MKELALLVGTPAAAATEAAPRAEATAELPAPDLFSATINDERTDIALFWEPAPGDTAEFYNIYADDLLVQKLNADGYHLLLRSLLIHDELTGRETYTVRGEDAKGNEGQPSNGMVPGPPGTLEPVTLTSAVFDVDAGTISLAWTPGEPLREEFAPTGLPYTIVADGVPVAGIFQTSLVVPLVDPQLYRGDLTGNETLHVQAGRRCREADAEPVVHLALEPEPPGPGPG